MSLQALDQVAAEVAVAPRVTLDQVEAIVVHEDYTVHSGVFIVATLELRNGFHVVGTSAAASPENFNEELGRKIARDNALKQVWMLEGYLLRQRLFESNQKG